MDIKCIIFRGTPPTVTSLTSINMLKLNSIFIKNTIIHIKIWLTQWEGGVIQKLGNQKTAIVIEKREENSGSGIINRKKEKGDTEER